MLVDPSDVLLANPLEKPRQPSPIIHRYKGVTDLLAYLAELSERVTVMPSR